MNSLSDATGMLKTDRTPWPKYRSESVLDFIERCRTRWDDETYEDMTVKVFSAGYCYHFAQMLQNTFGRGHICMAYPASHFVWEDVDGKHYDIRGLHETADYYVPVEYLGTKGIEAFLHVGKYDDEHGSDYYLNQYMRVRALLLWAEDYNIMLEFDEKFDRKILQMFDVSHMVQRQRLLIADYRGPLKPPEETERKTAKNRTKKTTKKSKATSSKSGRKTKDTTEG